MAFISDYLDCLARRTAQYGVPMERMLAERSVYVVPMLNPDGASYVLEGVDEENPLRERVLAMQGEQEISAWEANARGVDLRRNYNVDFKARKERERAAGVLGGAPQGFSGEYPESEPETAALCRFLRLRREQIAGVIDLHEGGEAIRCSCEDNLSAKPLSVGRLLARHTGYRITPPEQAGVTGDLSDFCIRVLGRPAYALYCGRKGEESVPRALARVRRALFTFPFLV
jgi:g-D-glutamyl-meso-diaminopimelate peptidase